MTVSIPLSKGFVTTIDDEDADLASLAWHAKGNGRIPYARHNFSDENGSTKSIYLHRIILERVLDRVFQNGEYVDHKDNNPLNNCRCNLRLADRQQNSWNYSRPVSSTSGYKGVSWHKMTGKWVAYIGLDGKKHHLGLFNTPEEAHAAYCAAALELHGEFANFGETP